MTSVEENYQCIKEIYNTIADLDDSKMIIFTLSPIPLNATFWNIPAIVADTISKSILRASIYMFEPCLSV
jgi:hypothetical protein